METGNRTAISRSDLPNTGRFEGSQNRKSGWRSSFEHCNLRLPATERARDFGALDD